MYNNHLHSGDLLGPICFWASLYAVQSLLVGWMCTCEGRASLRRDWACGAPRRVHLAEDLPPPRFSRLISSFQPLAAVYALNLNLSAPTDYSLDHSGCCQFLRTRFHSVIWLPRIVSS